jgi:hypothetical protein
MDVLIPQLNSITTKEAGELALQAHELAKQANVTPL